MRYLAMMILALAGCSSSEPIGPSDAENKGRDVSQGADTASSMRDVHHSGDTTSSSRQRTFDAGRMPEKADTKTSDADPDDTKSAADTAENRADTTRLDAQKLADAGTCECSNSDSPCCDGCHYLPEGTTCGESKTSEWCEAGKCGPLMIEVTKTYHVCDGQGYCDRRTKVIDQERCNTNQKCNGSDSDYRCVEDRDCY